MYTIRLHSLILTHACRTFSLCFVAILLACSFAYADKLTVTCAEKVGDKVIATKDPDSGEVSREQVTQGTFTIVVTRVWSKVDGEDQFDFRTLTADTAFAFSLGNFTYEGALSDDPKYFDGDKSATIAIKEDPTDPKSKNAIKIKLSGGKNKLQMVVSGRYPQAIVADDYLGRTKPVEAIITLNLNISDVDISNDVLILVKPKVVVRLIGKGDYQEEFELNQMCMTGRALVQSDE